MPVTNDTIKAVNSKLSEQDTLIRRISNYDVTLETLQANIASLRNLLADVQEDVTLNTQRTHIVEEVAQKVTELEERVMRKVSNILLS